MRYGLKLVLGNAERVPWAEEIAKTLQLPLGDADVALLGRRGPKPESYRWTTPQFICGGLDMAPALPHFRFSAPLSGAF